MAILVISHILPIPGIRKTNDFIFQAYSSYRNQFPEEEIVILTPVNYGWNFLKIIKGKSLKRRLNNRFSMELKGFQVEILPFLSTWRFRNVHAFITRSVYYLNRRRIQRLFSEHTFTIIHARYIFSDGILAHMLNRRYNIPYVVNTHNERFYFEHVYSRKVAKKILRNACRVLPLNHSNYLYFKSIGIKDIERSTHGFNQEFLRDQKPPSGQRIRIFTVADLIKLKNIDKVIMAIYELVEEFDVTYTVIGQGPEKRHLEELVNSLKLKEKVSFIDFIPHDKIAMEMYKHDIYIMPSYFETFGRVYFEVMAMGIPIICARDSGIYGIFKDGEEGIAVDHKDVDDIVGALRILVSNEGERQRIGSNGQSLVKNFTWENIARDLHEKYQECIQS